MRPEIRSSPLRILNGLPIFSVYSDYRRTTVMSEINNKLVVSEMLWP